MYRIEISKAVLKKLKTLPKKDLIRVAAKIDSLATDPYPIDMKKIKGDLNLYRIRVGVYRILYRIFDNLLQVIVTDVDHRKDVYK